MKKYLFVIVCLLFCELLVAQPASQFGIQNYRDLTQGVFIIYNNNPVNLKDVKGSPFLFEDFKIGQIIDTKNNQSITTNLRYDVLKDLFEIKLEMKDTDLKTIDRAFVYQYIINNEKFVIIESSEAINELHYNIGNGFVVELSDPKEKAVLYKRYFAEKKEGKPANSGYSEAIPPSITIGSRFIIKFGDKYVRAETNPKRIIKVFPKHQKLVENYIKKNKLKLKGKDKSIENQMQNIIAYYNTL